ncbi:hypothetical protein C2S53_006894 [Perilla frutescens var. hirtella]|uniref:Reverse transcriptase zinc-binding domain-containing protein n=1 Tax=Perilla frutescens var. hirtella TaxID=608512 RepID=A0AAD4JEN3_PERFH|nr:hypothetical protein C2S53_006894 [Perilla frutescens var. hirtella]
MAKTLWHIHEKKDSLWIKWAHIEYLKGRDIWQWKPHNRDSPLIKNLELIRNEIVQKNDDYLPAAQGVLNRWFKLGKRTFAVYHWLRQKEDKKIWQSFIWKAYVPQKYSFCMWLALLERLAKRDCLTYLRLDQLQDRYGKRSKIG